MPAALQQRLLGLGVVRLQFGVLDVAARAGAARVHGGREMAAASSAWPARRASRPEAFFRLRDVDAVAQQRLVFGGRLRARQQIRARQPGVGVGDRLLGEIRWRSAARLESERVSKVPGAEMPFDLRFDLRRRLAERVAVGHVLRDALPQVVQQHAQLAVVFGVDDQQMHARPIQIGLAAAAHPR